MIIIIIVIIVIIISYIISIYLLFNINKEFQTKIFKKNKVLVLRQIKHYRKWKKLEFEIVCDQKFGSDRLFSVIFIELFLSYGSTLPYPAIIIQHFDQYIYTGFVVGQKYTQGECSSSEIL